MAKRRALFGQVSLHSLLRRRLIVSTTGREGGIPNDFRGAHLTTQVGSAVQLVCGSAPRFQHVPAVGV